jgi:hypothetical protein
MAGNGVIRGVDACDWARLKEWFGQALEASPDQMDYILQQAQRESPTLALKLRLLLLTHLGSDADLYES